VCSTLYHKCSFFNVQKRITIITLFLFLQLTEYELCIASDLVDPLGMVVSWENIGGLEGTINEILETVILPFHDNLLASNSSLVQPPKGNLTAGCVQLHACTAPQR